MAHCTCDVYRSGTYNCYSYGSCSDTRHDYCTSNSSNCHTYATSGCNCNSNTQCHPDTGRIAYRCSGYRKAGDPTVYSYATYVSGTVISHEQINMIQTAIKGEIQQRKRHALYSGLTTTYTQPNVVQGNLVDHNQPNTINNAIAALRTYINGITKVGTGTVNGDHDATAPTSTYSTINTGNETYATASSHKDMHALEDDLSSMNTDCICHTDCSGYGQWYYRVCSCYGNCGCHYSDERLKNSIKAIGASTEI